MQIMISFVFTGSIDLLKKKHDFSAIQQCFKSTLYILVIEIRTFYLH